LGQVNGKVGSLSAVCENGVQKETIVGIRAILWVERDRGSNRLLYPATWGGPIIPLSYPKRATGDSRRSFALAKD
jgi:hypothetical protein